MIYFFRKGESRLAAETRLNPGGPGYELVITTDGEVRVESFEDLPGLLGREHELVQSWRAMGWRESTASPEATASPALPDDDWLGARR